MNVTARAIPTLAFLLLATLATACGVEGATSDTSAPAPTVAPATTIASTTTVDQPATTTTKPKSTTTTTKPSAPTTTSPGGDLPPGYQDQVLAGMIDAFVEGGLTQKQAECLADSYGRDILNGADIDMTDQNSMMKYFTDCGVNPLDLGN